MIGDIFGIREELLRACCIWKMLNPDAAREVHFSRNMNERKLDIIELRTDLRHSLFEYLKKNIDEVDGFKINMIMES